MKDNYSSKKYNEGCIKIFKFLDLLYEDKAFYEDVVQIFKHNTNENINVVLNKYLNTFKVFGLNVKKINNKFTLLNTPFSTKFNIDDCKIINMFEKIAKELPQSKTKDNLTGFVDNIKQNFDEKACALYKNLSENNDIDYSFYFSNFKQQVEMCEKYCSDVFNINIIYMKNTEKISVNCRPVEVIYNGKTVYFRVNKLKDSEFEDISVADILSIEYLPTQKMPVQGTNVIMYKLKGRLAKAYILKENEILTEICDDGSIVIMNKNEPINTLLNRLMRYDYECEILRPLYIKERMKEQINSTLNLYDEEKDGN